jgi:hypothetical protein
MLQGTRGVHQRTIAPKKRTVGDEVGIESVFV